MEPPEVREQFNEWAKIERANHAAAHPEYKFSPSKTATKRRKDEDSDEDEPDGLDDPDGEYRGGRSVRQRKQTPQEPAFLPSSHGFETTPYYGPQNAAYEQVQYQYVVPGRPLPSNVAYDHNGLPYNPQTGTYIQTAGLQATQYQYAVQEPLPPRAPTPQALGNYGLPGGQPQELFATSSRTSTPQQQYAQQYGQPIYPQYQTLQQYQQPATAQVYEHQQYLQAQMQPQQAIDPSLEIMLGDSADAAANGHGMPDESHFETAMGDLGGLEYYDQQTSPDATLAPSWPPTD